MQQVLNSNWQNVWRRPKATRALQPDMHRLSHLRISGLGGSVQVWRSEFCSSEQKFPIFANTTLAMILRRRLVTTRRGKIIEILRAAQLLVAFAAGMRREVIHAANRIHTPTLTEHWNYIIQPAEKPR